MPSSPLAVSPNEANYSYFNLPSTALVTPPLLLNFSNPSASDDRDFQALGWSRNMPRDKERKEASNSNSFFTSRRTSRSKFSQRHTGPLFGVDPPRPPREGYE
ncbi:hypothetical protein E4U30_004857 [Claviceps sp. LM220 group G6]|nr:hypothetical protein E4U30_004857 [Claviceps sp. LM220 group G6]